MTPAEAPRWQALEARIRDVARRFGFGELRTPVIEARELFQRTVGESTDIVQKEMYVLRSHGGSGLYQSVAKSMNARTLAERCSRCG